MAIRYGNRYRPDPHRAKFRPADFGYPPLEKTLAGRTIQALRRIGCDVSSTQQTGPSRQTEGMPDLWVTHAAWGVFCWIEMKRPGTGRASKVQREWHERCRSAGVPVLICTGPEDAVRQVGGLPRNQALWAKKGRAVAGTG